MGNAAVDQLTDYVCIGPRPYLDRLAREYGLPVAELLCKAWARQAQFSIGGDVFDVEYLVHMSLLRSHGGFGCAGDLEALQFCRDVAEEMVRRFGIARDEAVAAINRQWPHRGRGRRTPPVWIVGLDTAYHQTEASWAERIFHGQVSAGASRGHRTAKPRRPPDTA